MSYHPSIERISSPIGLSEAAKGAPRRVFFGGSFDPPHLGHAGLPMRVAQLIGSDTRVVYVPAGRSPFKSDVFVEAHHRIAMLELALRDQTRWEIWEQELGDAAMNPGEPSYWADTWSIVRRMELPGANRFLIGADQALSMHRWRRYGEFWKDAVVMLRDDSGSVDSFIDRIIALGIWSDHDIEHWREQVIVVPLLDVSSTGIREALAAPSLRDGAIAGFDPLVQRYILEHGLYQ